MAPEAKQAMSDRGHVLPSDRDFTPPPAPKSHIRSHGMWRSGAHAENVRLSYMITRQRYTRPVRPDAIVFDLDAILVDSEATWAQARANYAKVRGMTWTDEDNAGIIGMGPKDSSIYIRDRLRLPDTLEEIQAAVVQQLLNLYAKQLPLVSGAVTVLHNLAQVAPLGLASSSARIVIDAVIQQARFDRYLSCTISAEEVPEGKPSPAIYTEACRLMSATASNSIAIEDSAAGIQSALNAEMCVIAIPNVDYPPPPALLARTSLQLANLKLLTSNLIYDL